MKSNQEIEYEIIHLNEIERGRIIGLHKVGIVFREIAGWVQRNIIRYERSPVY